MMSEFFEKLIEKVDIDEGMQGIRDILLSIYRNGTISTKKISRQTKIPIPIVSKIVNTLIEKDMLCRNEYGVQFWDHAMKFIEDYFQFYGYGINSCPTCSGRPHFISPRIEQLFEILNPIFEKRPQADTSLDQSKNTVETAIQRALYFYNKGALEGNDVLFLGDDDFTSIAVAYLYTIHFPDDPKLIPKSVTVIDIDDRILTMIRDQFKELNFNVNTINYDIRKSIPKDIKARFDTIITDPAYSYNGLKLFISRAISLLKTDFRNKIGFDIFLSYAHRSPNKTLEMQQVFNELGLAAMEIIPGFNKYEGSEVLGNITQLIHLKTTKSTQSLIDATKDFTDILYTGETHPYIRKYECIACQRIIEIGPDMEFETIELLKGAKCPKCHKSKKFRLISRNITDID